MSLGVSGLSVSGRDVSFLVLRSSCGTVGGDWTGLQSAVIHSTAVLLSAVTVLAGNCYCRIVLHWTVLHWTVLHCTAL